jgi:site-specific DNA-methyltransferase (cytosine-N4-specific)
MSAYYDDGMVQLHHGDAAAVASELPPRSVRTIVTSPPYFGLRDYGEDGQIGAEETLQEYVDRLVAVFGALRDVLTDDGTLWLNLGDSYAGSGAPGGVSKTLVGTPNSVSSAGKIRPKPGVLKNLLGVPWRVAFALQDDGWILRSDIIWAKPNPMPESVTDRPTKAHEYLFLLAKSPRYYYDAEAIAEEAVRGDAGSRYDEGKTAAHQLGRAQKGPRFGGTKYGDDDSVQSRTKSGNVYVPDGTRNRRTVWTVPTVPFPGAHFAVYPPELIRPCILAGSAPGDTVLDPFSGSGTTGMVATQEGRRYVGIDLNREYLDLSLRTRFAQPVLDLTGGPKIPECPDCGSPHDTAPCRAGAYDCDCCRAILGGAA